MSALLWVVCVACAKGKPPVIPGATDLGVASVAIAPRGDETLEVDYGALYARLGVQAGGPGWNPFRVAEDRRRIQAFLHDAGYFDAAVDPPALVHTTEPARVAITWPVHEGRRYTIASVELVGAPDEHRRALDALVPFAAGDRVALPVYRAIRTSLADHLRTHGYGRASAYSRTFVDRASHTVAWVFYVEPGPKTRIKSIDVGGAHRVSAAEIVERTGLRPGASYSTAEKLRAEFALLDTGSFASASVLSEADAAVPANEGGGVMTPEQIGADGTFVPRQLDDQLAVRVHVVEAPARQLRAEVGAEADLARVDAFAAARVQLRDLFGPFQHLVLEGNVGHGWLVDRDDPVQGVYGGARARYLRPGFITRDLELRVTAQWRDTLAPSALLRELSAGPGVRSTLAPGVFVEADVLYRHGRHLGLPALDATSVMELQLPTSDTSRGLQLVGGVTVDRRNDRVEPTRGWLLLARASYAPGGAASDHRWLQTVGEARGFVPLSPTWSVAGRARFGAVTLGGEGGVPMVARLFGGGVDGMRGFARDHLSPTACPADGGDCDLIVGGRSLFESSLELRYLPRFMPYGGALFVDAGAAGRRLNPFEVGVSVAAGVGIRLRSWYVPIGVDLGYRVVDQNRVGASTDRLLVFVHVGEAF
jgi:translocation and assembly module TamA